MIRTRTSPSRRQTFRHWIKKKRYLGGGDTVDEGYGGSLPLKNEPT
jgi:hypothetical protein